MPAPNPELIAPTRDQLRDAVGTMVVGGVALIPDLGVAREDIEALSYAGEHTDRGLSYSAKDRALWPDNLNQIDDTISELLGAERVLTTLLVKDALEPGDVIQSHIDIVTGSCVASLLVPVSGPDAKFAFGWQRFGYPFEEAPADVTTLEYGVGKALLLRMGALQIKTSVNAKPTTPPRVEHGGWSYDGARQIMFVNYYRSKGAYLLRRVDK